MQEIRDFHNDLIYFRPSGNYYEYLVGPNGSIAGPDNQEIWVIADHSQSVRWAAIKVQFRITAGNYRFIVKDLSSNDTFTIANFEYKIHHGFKPKAEITPGGKRALLTSGKVYAIRLEPGNDSNYRVRNHYLESLGVKQLHIDPSSPLSCFQSDAKVLDSVQQCGILGFVKAYVLDFQVTVMATKPCRMILYLDAIRITSVDILVTNEEYFERMPSYIYIPSIESATRGRRFVSYVGQSITMQCVMPACIQANRFLLELPRQKRV